MAKKNITSKRFDVPTYNGMSNQIGYISDEAVAATEGRMIPVSKTGYNKLVTMAPNQVRTDVIDASTSTGKKNIVIPDSAYDNALKKPIGQDRISDKKKKTWFSDMSTIDKVGMGINALATVGTMVSAAKGIHDVRRMKEPEAVSYNAVDPKQIDDRSGARKAASDAEIDNTITDYVRMNQAAGRVPDSGNLSVVKLDAERKNAAQIEAEKQQTDSVNAQMENQAKGANAQLSLSANAQTIQNRMNFNAMRTQLKTQNVNALIEAPMNLAGSLISYNNAKESMGHARKMEKLNLLQAQMNTTSDNTEKWAIQNQIKNLLKE